MKAEEEARRNKESLFIRHYFQEYGSPVLPPCWMLAEALSMGTWSKAYGMLAERSDQKPVADFFRASPPELISWIHALTNLRNTCAHHSRLWDRRFVTCPSRKGNLKTAVTTNDRLFAQIAACLYCLWSVEPASQWFAKLSLPRTLHHHPRRSRPPSGPGSNPPNSCGQSHPLLGFRGCMIHQPSKPCPPTEVSESPPFP